MVVIYYLYNSLTQSYKQITWTDGLVLREKVGKTSLQ